MVPLRKRNQRNAGKTKMTKAILSPDQDAVISEIEIAAPPARVFQALTTAAELKCWFSSPECPAHVWEMDPRPGGRYRYTTEKGSIEINGVREFECHGEILEFDPPRVLVYTWLANWHDEVNHRTIVRWELAPTETGTHVKVTHSGLASMPVVRKDYAGGWPGVVEMLKKFVEK
jgi:uncharacterized protein YndB with AHSA1/START domain